MFLPEQWFLSF